MFRVHTAGSVGGTTAIVAASHVQAGKHRTVLAVAFEKQSEGNAQFALGSGKGASLGAGGAFAPFIRAYIHRSGAPEDIGWRVAVKDRLNALKNPYAHLQDRGHLDREGQGVTDDVGADPVPRVVPVARTVPARWCSPTRPAATRRPPTVARRRGCWARRRGPSRRPSPGATRSGRGRAVCADDVYARAGITDPRHQIDMAELYVPFSWHEAIWLEAHGLCRRGRRLEADRGRHDRARRSPADQRVGRRAVEQPDRRVRSAALRRGREPGARRGR